MKISTEIRSVSRHVGEEKAIEMIAKAGFDAWDFSMLCMVNYNWSTNVCSPCDHPLASNEYLKFVRRLKQVGLDNGIVCNQSHAPYPTYCKAIRDTFERALECTAEAGGEICVIHPDNFKSAEENAEMFFELLPVAKQYGVKIAAENMWSWSDEKHCVVSAACSDPKSFNEHLDAVNDESFVACLDIGHAEMHGLGTNAAEMILALGTRLQSLHIHDNDRYHDSHQIPFSMELDFDAVAKALKQINYSGYLTLEAVLYLAHHTKDNLFEGVCDLARAAKRLSDMIES